MRTLSLGSLRHSWNRPARLCEGLIDDQQLQIDVVEQTAAELRCDMDAKRHRRGGSMSRQQAP
jgi:hypothetical protein